MVCLLLDPEDAETKVMKCKAELRRIIFYMKPLPPDIVSTSLNYESGCPLNILDILCPGTRM